MASRRKEIIEFIVTQLKEIDGAVSGFDASYTYNTNVFNNVFRKLKFLDEVNDFPSIYVSAGTENRDFNSQNLTTATLDATIRIYIYGEDDAQSQVDNLLQDVEHVIYSLGDNSNRGILDITISNISTDEGLVTPYGLGEIELEIFYTLQ
jgi:hypothetical protein